MPILVNFPDRNYIEDYRRYLESHFELPKRSIKKYLKTKDLITLWGPSFHSKLAHPIIYGFVLEDTEEYYIHPDNVFKLYAKYMQNWITKIISSNSNLPSP